MPYFPGIPPENADDFRRWLADELNRLNPNVIEGQDYQGFKIHYAEPDKYEIGQIVFAAGGGSPNWNPGAGQGMYEYTELGWAKLGGGDGNVVPTSHSVLQDLTADDHTQYLTNARGDVRYYLKSYIDALTIQQLTNVTTTGPVDAEVLTWDAGTMQWINQALPAVQANNLDGGFPSDTYLPNQNVDGGTP